MRVAVVGPSRFGLGEPFAGGLEAHTATLARCLHVGGHEVTVFAGPTDAPHGLPCEVVPIIRRSPARVARLDTSNPAWFARHEDESYAAVADLVNEPHRFDVVHNNSLHRRLVDNDGPGTPTVHTLHCPPFDALRSAHLELARRERDRRVVVAVSRRLAAAWSGTATDIVHNGVDLERWSPPLRRLDRRSRSCAWAGRIIADKAPHLAIDAARHAGYTITLAGPIHDHEYFDAAVRPRLSPGDATWVGPLDVDGLRRLFHDADVGLVTPMWDEPFGLVAAEMLACGLPVAMFDNGALREFTDPTIAAYAPPGDVGALADALRVAAAIDRSACRRRAVTDLSIEAMVARYVALYRAVVDDGVHRRCSAPGTRGVSVGDMG